MSRVKRGVMHAKRRRNLLKKAKGYKWGRKSKIKLAKIAVTKAGVFAYKHRREYKRDMRGLWQIHINAGVRPLGITYSKFINALKKKNIALDRKILSILASDYPKILEAIVSKIK